MKPIIKAIEANYLKKELPDFRIGDTVSVQVKVKEGDRERLQAFEGVVIAMRRRGLNSSFTVRKISQGEGVERVFQTHSPSIDSVKIVRRGDVKRAKLYYLRERTGRAARIREKMIYNTEDSTSAEKPATEKNNEAEAISEKPIKAKKSAGKNKKAEEV